MLAYVASVLGYIYAMRVHSFGLLMGYIFLHTERFFQLLKFMCRYNQLHFLSKYVHFTRPNDIRGGALTLKNLATLDDEKVCWFWHCTTFFFSVITFYNFHFRVLLGNLWPPALQVILISAKNKKN